MTRTWFLGVLAALVVALVGTGLGLERGEAEATAQRLVTISAPAARVLEIPVNTWIARRLPGVGKAPTGGKHQRAAFNHLNGRIYFLGGDWLGPFGLASGRNELYSYAVADDTWVLEHPYCGPPGSVQPSHPDEVGWVYDTRRNVFWMLPGYMGGSQENCPDSTMVRFEIMTFDPVSRTWSWPRRKRLVWGETSKFAQYDAATDRIVIVYFDGANGATVGVYHIKSDSWTAQVHRGAANNARLGQEYMALDPVARRIYIVSPHENRLYRYDMDSRQLTAIADTPRNAGPDLSHIVWDPTNRVLLWPQVDDYVGSIRLHVFDPATGKWKLNLPIHQPEGLPVRGTVAVFDPAQNVLVVMGGHSNPYLFLYRYGREGAAAAPSGAPQEAANGISREPGTSPQGPSEGS
jgi:hypothetical protein